VTDVWAARAQAYVDSDAHREGEDLDQLVAWAGALRTVRTSKAALAAA